MPRTPVIVALIAAASLVACDSGTSSDTAPASTTDPITATTAAPTVPTTTPPTAAPATTAPTTVATTTAATDPKTASAGDIVVLDQFGMSFQIPEPFVNDPKDDVDFRATAPTQRGLMTILDCGDCTLDDPARGEETRTNREIDGVPTVIIENADLNLPDSVASNELLVVDDQRNFSVIMSFEGDIEPVWDAFIDSISFTDPDPTAVSTSPTDNPSATGGPVTIESVGVTFVPPEGFDGELSDGEDFTGYSATRVSPSVAALLVLPCPTCTRQQVESQGPITELEVDGQPAVVTDITSQETPGRVMLIFSDPGPVIVTMVGEDFEDAWTEFFDSITIESN